MVGIRMNGVRRKVKLYVKREENEGKIGMKKIDVEKEIEVERRRDIKKRIDERVFVDKVKVSIDKNGNNNWFRWFKKRRYF